MEHSFGDWPPGRPNKLLFVVVSVSNGTVIWAVVIADCVVVLFDEDGVTTATGLFFIDKFSGSLNSIMGWMQMRTFFSILILSLY